MHTPYRYATLTEVETLLNKEEVLGFDVETAIKQGKYSKICLAQFYQTGMDEVLIVKYPDPIQLLLLVDQFKWVAHNAHYEITTMQRQTSTRWIPKTFEDSFLLARLHYYDKERFTLDQCMSYALGFCPYEKQNLDKSVMQKSNYDVPVLSDAQCRYAACDVYHLIELYDKVKASEDETSYQLDMSFLRACLDFQNNGMPVQEDRLMLKLESNLEEIAEYDLGINVNSYIQVRKKLDSTKSDASALMRMWLEDGNEVANQINTVRKLIKQNSFIEKFDSIEGRIYGTFKPSARSGRSTSDDQNLQQIPRKLKGVFGTKPGRVLVYADYAQIELRTICAITSCQKMAELFREGKDLHNYTRDFIFGSADALYEAGVATARERRGDNVTQEELDEIRHGAEITARRYRQISKTCNFNFLYGGGVPVFLGILMMQAEILMGESEGFRVRKKWRKLWKEIFGWQQKGISEWQSGKTGSTALGRKYKAKMMTDYLNIENQGTAAEVAKLAQHRLEPKLKALREKWKGCEILQCNFVHDSWIIECDDNPEQYKDVSYALADAMQGAWFEVAALLRITDLPMPVNVAVGTNWGDIENDDVPNIWDFELEGMTHYANV